MGVLGRARFAQGQALGTSRMLEGELGLEAWSSVLVADGVTTSAIEGETLDARAVRSSVARHLGLPAAGLPAPSRTVEGLVQVLLDATCHHGRPLTRARLMRWHAALFPTGRSGLHDVRAGELRGKAPMQVVSGRLGRERVHFEAPPRGRLLPELSAFLRWYASPPRGLDGLLRAGVAHLWFLTLHPFEDGNGRIARALTDMALAQDEQAAARSWSLSSRILAERDAYYALLEQTQRGGLDVTPWLGWFLEQVERAASDAHAVAGRTVAKARFWLRHAAETLGPRQVKALNRLLDAGPSGFEGGLTARKYAGMNHCSRATATRELGDLVSRGCIVPNGKGGRSAAYELRWP
ncbi:MAG: hypothetical protein RL653_4402 [Pseudomonadota bacterium]|jgi:Fic family protein